MNQKIQTNVSTFNILYEFHFQTQSYRKVCFELLTNFITFILGDDSDDDGHYDTVYATSNTTRNHRVAAKDFKIEVIENPYYGDVDEATATESSGKRTVQRKDAGFTTVTALNNLYYE